MQASVSRAPVSDVRLMIGRITGVGAAGGLAGGVVMIEFMMVYMAATGAGFWSPLNIGPASLAYTITPPAALMPMLAKLIGGHATPAMMHMMSAVRSGHATNARSQRG